MTSSGSTQASPDVRAGWADRELVPTKGARLALGIAGFVLATALSAYVVVPWTPVPMTLQPLVVLLCGALLGPWAGAAAMATYLGIGAAGAPVFSAGHAGVAWLLGPTGGYLFAFPAAAFAVGLIAGGGSASRGPAVETGRVLFGLLTGLALLYVGGVSQLAILTGQDLGALVAVGVLPFLSGDVTKVLIALVVVLAVRRTREGRSPGGL